MKKLRLLYDKFYDFRKVKPREFTQCVVLWQGSSGKEYVTFGIYEGPERGFYILGGHLDIDVVRYWTDIEVLGKLEGLPLHSK